jgi:hypothetical protein
MANRRCRPDRATLLGEELRRFREQGDGEQNEDEDGQRRQPLEQGQHLLAQRGLQALDRPGELHADADGNRRRRNRKRGRLKQVAEDLDVEHPEQLAPEHEEQPENARKDGAERTQESVAPGKMKQVSIARPKVTARQP